MRHIAPLAARVAYAAQAPALVCINLQEEWIAPASPYFVPRHPTVLRQAALCLNWARRNDLAVVHVHTLRPHDRNREENFWSRPIAGFEPRAREAVVAKHGRSFFDTEEFLKAGDFSFARGLYALGFALADDCLAASYDAERIGADFILIDDAVASPGTSSYPSEVVDGVIWTVLAPFVKRISTDALTQMSARRFLPELAQ